jgi:hypothetical protein
VNRISTERCYSAFLESIEASFKAASFCFRACMFWSSFWRLYHGMSSLLWPGLFCLLNLFSDVNHKRIGSEYLFNSSASFNLNSVIFIRIVAIAAGYSLFPSPARGFPVCSLGYPEALLSSPCFQPRRL